METKLKMGLPLEPTQAKQRPPCRGTVCVELGRCLRAKVESLVHLRAGTAQRDK